MEAERSQRLREQKLIEELKQTRQENETLKAVTGRIESNGWSMDVLVNNKPNQEPVNPQILELQQRQGKLEADMEAKSAALELSEIRAHINAFPDQYQLIRLKGLEHKVKEVIDYHYQKDRKLLSYPEAARALESEILKWSKQDLEHMASTQKGKELLASVTGVPASQSQSQPKVKETDKTAIQPSETPNKPKPYVPVMPEMAKIVVRPVSQLNGNKEERYTINPSNTHSSKQDEIAKVLAQFGMS